MKIFTLTFNSSNPIRLSWHGSAFRIVGPRIRMSLGDSPDKGRNYWTLVIFLWLTWIRYWTNSRFADNIQKPIRKIVIKDTGVILTFQGVEFNSVVLMRATFSTSMTRLLLGKSTYSVLYKLKNQTHGLALDHANFIRKVHGFPHIIWISCCKYICSLCNHFNSELFLEQYFLNRFLILSPRILDELVIW